MRPAGICQSAQVQRLIMQGALGRMRSAGWQARVMMQQNEGGGGNGLTTAVSDWVSKNVAVANGLQHRLFCVAVFLMLCRSNQWHLYVCISTHGCSCAQACAIAHQLLVAADDADCC